MFYVQLFGHKGDTQVLCCSILHGMSSIQLIFLSAVCVFFFSIVSSFCVNRLALSVTYFQNHHMWSNVRMQKQNTKMPHRSIRSPNSYKTYWTSYIVVYTNVVIILYLFVLAIHFRDWKRNEFNFIIDFFAMYNGHIAYSI